MNNNWVALLAIAQLVQNIKVLDITKVALFSAKIKKKPNLFGKLKNNKLV